MPDQIYNYQIQNQQYYPNESERDVRYVEAGIRSIEALSNFDNKDIEFARYEDGKLKIDFAKYNIVRGGVKREFDDLCRDAFHLYPPDTLQIERLRYSKRNSKRLKKLNSHLKHKITKGKINIFPRDGLKPRNIPPQGYKGNLSTDDVRVGTFEIQNKWNELNNSYHALFGYRAVGRTSFELEIDFAKVGNLTVNDRKNFKRLCGEIFKKEDCDRIQVEIDRFNERKCKK